MMWQNSPANTSQGLKCKKVHQVHFWMEMISQSQNPNTKNYNIQYYLEHLSGLASKRRKKTVDTSARWKDLWWVLNTIKSRGQTPTN
jgi:hypothetical protein